MKSKCLLDVNDGVKSLVSQKLGLPVGVTLDSKDLRYYTEQYCIEHNVDIDDYDSYREQIADYIAKSVDINQHSKAIYDNLATGLNVSEAVYDSFYEQNQMLLNVPIENNSDNILVAQTAHEVHKFSNIIHLSDGRIMITFPDVTFGKVRISPNKRDALQFVDEESQGDKRDNKSKTATDYKLDFLGMVDELKKTVFRGKNFETTHKYYVLDDNGYEFTDENNIKHIGIEAKSVTQLAKGQYLAETAGLTDSEKAAWLAIGTSFDRFVRDYFKHGRDYVLNDGIYENIPVRGSKNNLREELVSQLDYFKKALDKAYKDGYEIITEDIILASKTSSGYVAGSPDIIVIDNSGVIHVYDMKTFSGMNINDKSIQEYRTQLSLYSDMIQSNIDPATGLTVDKSIGLLEARVQYPSVDDTEYGDKKNFYVKNGTVFRDEAKGSKNAKSISSYNHYDIKIQIAGSDGIIGGYIHSIAYKEYQEQLSGLTKQEKQDLQDMPDYGFSKPNDSEPDKSLDEYFDSRPDVVFGSGAVVPDSDVVKISNRIVKLMSLYTNMLMNDTRGDLASYVIGADSVKKNELGFWEEMPKDPVEFLTRPDMYRKMYKGIIGIYFPYLQSDYNDWINDNSDYMMNISFGAAKKIWRELSVNHNGSAVIQIEDINAQELYDYVKDEFEQSIEAYDIDKRTIKTSDRMPQELKRKLFAMPKYEYDDNGNIQHDEFGVPVIQHDELGLPDFVDEDDVIGVLNRNLFAMKSLSDMRARLEELVDAYPWVRQVLNMLDKNSQDYDKAASDVFFKTFRKAETRYSKIYESKGVFVMIPTNNNRKWIPVYDDSVKRMLDPYSETITLFDHKEDSDDIFGLYVNSDALDEIQYLMEDLSDTIYNKPRFYKRDAIKYIKQIFDIIGIHVPSYDKMLKMLSKSGGDNSKGKAKIGAANIYSMLADDNGVIKLAEKYLRSDNNNLSVNSPLLFNGLQKLIQYIEPALDENIESTERDNDKTYLTYTESSPLQDIIFELRGDNMPSMQQNEDYLSGVDQGVFGNQEHRYNRFRQYRRIDDGRPVYVSSWLRKLSSDDGRLRNAIQHYVHTSTDGKPYFKQSDDLYMMSLLSGYFKPSQIDSFNVRGSKMALFRVPVISDKNSQEWIMFEKEAVVQSLDDEGLNEMKTEIAKSAREFLYFELQRMQSVLNHLRNGRSEDDIKNYHLHRDKASALKENVAFDDIIENGKLRDYVMQSGMSFRYLPMLNNEIAGRTEFGKAVLDVLNAKNEADTQKAMVRVSDLFDNAFISGMDKAYDVFRKSLSEFVVRQAGVLSNSLPEDTEYLLKEYFYNDFIATANILNLTMADPAFFKDTIDLQKRFAQYHSQTQKVNKEAEFTDENGETKRFSDGKFRFVTIKTLKFRSPLEQITKDVFKELLDEEKLKNGTESMRYQELKTLYETVPGFFKKVDVTDGQAYHSITPVWKKLNMLGQIDEQTDKFYKGLKGLSEGQFTMKNFSNVIQSMKPVVTGFVETPDQSFLASDEGTMLVPTYIKDSESLILIAGAIMTGANKNNVLSALYKFMEKSAFSGDKQTLSSYNGAGIDTICFDSAVKTGVNNVIDINDCKTEQEIIDKLNSLCYKDGKYTRYVKEMDFDSWGIQQNVPDHMQDHEQDLGSQTRVLGMTDLEESDFSDGVKVRIENEFSVNVNGTEDTDKIWTYSNNTKTYTSKEEFLKDYVGFINKEFEIGLIELNDMFGIGLDHQGRMIVTDKTKFNESLSVLAQENIIKDQKYSMELLRAVRFLDSNREFIMPIGDPQIADSLFGFVFQQIKNLVNKQKVPGGPVVQVSPFGLSDNLNIVDGNENTYSIDDGNGNKIPNPKFNPKTGLIYECYITAPTDEIERMITRKDGSIMTIQEIIDKGIMSPEQLKFIAYRIPTEDKYSIYRMRIAGFVSRRAGEVIIMPQELTALSGTDFDIDKMYCWFKKTTSRKTDKLTERDVVHNNMFNMQWASLGLWSSVQHQLDPGNYKLLQKIADEVSVKSDDDDSILYPNNQVKIKKTNAAGKNYVGIAALNNTCHGLSTFADIRFKNTFEFNIDGVTHNDIGFIDNEGNLYFQLDPIKSRFDGSRVSKTLSMFVGASADNAKEMLLGRLNTNPTTASVVMAAVRMGFPIRAIVYMMKMPYISMLIDDAESGGKQFETVIQNEFKELHPDGEADSSTRIDTENMLNAIHGKLNDSDLEKLNDQVITFLYNLIPYSRAVSNLNTIMSLNSTKNAVGPTIYDVMSKWMKIDQVKQSIQDGNTVFADDTWDKIVSSVPYIETLSRTYDIAMNLCSNISPVCGQEVVNIMHMLSQFETQNNITSEKNVKALINGYLIYRASKIGVFDNNNETRDDLLYNFPIKFLKEQGRYRMNEFLSVLKVTDKMNKFNRIPNIKLDMSQSNIDVTDRLQASWGDIVSLGDDNPFAEDMQNLSDTLIQYMVMRFGFMWQPNSAMNIAPNKAKMTFVSKHGSRYTKLFSTDATEGWSDIVDVVNVINQFARNNPDCGLWKPTVVYKIKNSSYIPESAYTKRTYGYKSKGRLYVAAQSEPVARTIEVETSDGAKMKIRAIRVKDMPRLGIDKNFMEYNAETNIRTIVSRQKSENAIEELDKIVQSLMAHLAQSVSQDSEYSDAYNPDNNEPTPMIDSPDDTADTPTNPNNDINVSQILHDVRRDFEQLEKYDFKSRENKSNAGKLISMLDNEQYAQILDTLSEMFYYEQDENSELPESIQNIITDIENNFKKANLC